jgi:hypothetical protein
VNPLYPLVAARAGHRCEYCRAPEAIFNFPFEVEHIMPISRGGTDEQDNLALACRACNLRKADFVTGLDEDGNAGRLFDPRRDLWDSHFRFDSGSGEIIGVSSVGSGTVARLKMNGELHLVARLQWMRLGLFP